MIGIHEVELKRYEFANVKYVNTEFIKDAGWNEIYIENMMRYTLHAYIFGQQLAYQEVKYPANWKEAVKERFAPAWMKERWPVQYTIHRLEAAALFPDMALRGRPYSVRVFDEVVR